MFVVALTIAILLYVWHLIKSGQKFIGTLAIIFISITIIFDTPYMIENGISMTTGEIMTFINIIILAIIIWLVKTKPLNAWFVN